MAPLAALGWTEFFEDQMGDSERHLAPRRISSVHRTRVDAIDANGPAALVLPPNASTADLAVGDWVLADPASHLLVRRLERQTLLQRRTESRNMPQLAAANIDTLFIVTSCNVDFNLARLERYVALANQAGTVPVIVLTKADLGEAAPYETEAKALQRDLPVVVLNAKSADAVLALAPWCGFGQTVGLVGSSGVGKSTLVNTLAGANADGVQKTGEIREHDSQGRHTTTARSLHAMAGGGWVIDTPGMRTLYVSDASEGIDTLFAEITELVPLCKFRDCTHVHEPGCAVQAAIRAGTLPVERFERWQTMSQENRSNTPVLSGPRGNKVVRPKKY